MVVNFKSKLSKLKKGEVVIITSPFLMLIFYKICQIFSIKTICQWKLITGQDCIGCGITRAIISILKFNFKEAIEYNPLVIIVFPLLIYVWIKYIYRHLIK